MQQYKHKVHVEKLELTSPSSKHQLTPPRTSPGISAAMDRWSAKFFCPPGAVGRHAHPTKCAQYYDCSKTNSIEWWGENLRECPYPKVFNELTKDCDSPLAVVCNTRQKPMDPCKYKWYILYQKWIIVGNPSWYLKMQSILFVIEYQNISQLPSSL